MIQREQRTERYSFRLLFHTGHNPYQKCLPEARSLPFFLEIARYPYKDLAPHRAAASETAYVVSLLPCTTLPGC